MATQIRSYSCLIATSEAGQRLVDFLQDMEANTNENQSLLFIQSTHFSFVIQGRRNYVEEQGGDTSSTPQSLADTLTIFQSGEADYPSHIDMSPLDLKMFCRAFDLVLAFLYILVLL